MHSFLIVTCLTATLLIATTSQVAKAEERVFTDVSGRKLPAELIQAGESSIKVKLKNGSVATIEIARLSDDDRAYIKEWQAENGRKAEEANADAAAKQRAAEIPIKMAAYCKQQLGKKVGNGECWTLANEAFKACGLKRPGKDIRVWGRLLDLNKEKMQPGDIVEYRSAKFSDGSTTGPEHTAVVVKGGKRKATIAEQNWGGNKTVREKEFHVDMLVAGKIMVYRPE